MLQKLLVFALKKEFNYLLQRLSATFSKSHYNKNDTYPDN